VHATSSSGHDADRRGDHRHRDGRDHQGRLPGHAPDHDRDHRDHRTDDRVRQGDQGHLRDADHRGDQGRQYPPDHDRSCWRADDPCVRQSHQWDADHRGDLGHQDHRYAAVEHHQDDGNHRAVAEWDDRYPAEAEWDDRSVPIAVAAVASAVAVAEPAAGAAAAAELQVCLVAWVRQLVVAQRQAACSSRDARTKSLLLACRLSVSPALAQLVLRRARLLAASRLRSAR